MKDLPHDHYLEQVEKALRGDRRFEHLITDHSEITIWNLLVTLQNIGVYTSYLLDEMDYKYV